MTTPRPVKADAHNRTWRTLLQGAAATVAVAVVTAVLDATGTGQWTWRTLAVAACTAALTAVASYVHRTVLDPSRLPSARPPTDGRSLT